jgi:uncharacterized iron-regulated protein
LPIKRELKGPWEGWALGVLASGLLSLPVFAEPVTRPAALAERLMEVDVIILGEVHDNPEHHVFQTAVMEAVGPSSVVFEMVTSDAAALVTPDLADDAEALAEALEWEASGWPDFAMYFPLFQQAAGSAVYGALVPREEARGAFSEGAAAVFRGDAARYALTEPLDPDEQAAREQEQQEAHCNALPEDILPGFVEAQRLRDAALADAALTALETHGAPVVIVTGNGHARTDWGVPALLAVAAPDVTVFALGQFEAEPVSQVPFDAWTVADPVDRPDPCAAFR